MALNHSKGSGTTGARNAELTAAHLSGGVHGTQTWLFDDAGPPIRKDVIIGNPAVSMDPGPAIGVPALTMTPDGHDNGSVRHALQPSGTSDEVTVRALLGL